MTGFKDVRTCEEEGCGRSLEHRHKLARYCSYHSTMRKRAADRKRLKPKVEAICWHCKLPYDRTTTQRRYCSERCRFLATKERQVWKKNRLISTTKTAPPKPEKPHVEPINLQRMSPEQILRNWDRLFD